MIGMACALNLLKVYFCKLDDYSAGQFTNVVLPD
jgi:hypothetical protein